jgi:hypothetical protein
MMSQISQSEVLEAFKAADETLCKLPPEQWAGWITWLLEDKDEELLIEIRDELNQRLESGRW